MCNKNIFSWIVPAVAHGIALQQRSKLYGRASRRFHVPFSLAFDHLGQTAFFFSARLMYIGPFPYIYIHQIDNGVGFIWRKTEQPKRPAIELS
jgi:hypothetical protein